MRYDHVVMMEYGVSHMEMAEMCTSGEVALG